MKQVVFANAGYYLSGFILLAVLGFWPSYFSQLLDPTVSFNFYFHFHAVIALVWILTVIIQPILIKRGQYKRHRQIGKLSYLIFGLVFISVLLLIHDRHTIDQENLAGNVFIPFKDLIILAIAYPIAIYFKNNVAIHSRAMIATGLVFVEPALVRLIMNVFDRPEAGYLWTIAIVYTIFLTLIVMERKQTSGRWVFPTILFVYIIVHSVIIFRLPLSGFDSFCKWFLSLPLT